MKAQLRDDKTTLNMETDGDLCHVYMQYDGSNFLESVLLDVSEVRELIGYLMKICEELEGKR